MPFVLDNSVVSGWILASQATPYTQGIAGLLGEQEAIAPPLLCLESTNVLRTAVKRQRLTTQTALEMLARLSRLPVTIDPHPAKPALLFALALRHDLTAYDAVYLELGLRHQLPIATQDAALTKAAIAAGIGVVRV